MTEKSKFNKMLEEIIQQPEIQKIRRKVERARKIESQGGNKFQVLEARVSDPDTGKHESDLVIYAIQQIKTPEEAKQFLDGYILDLQQSPEKYPMCGGNPKEHIGKDIRDALHFFESEETHEMWEKVLKKYQ